MHMSIHNYCMSWVGVEILAQSQGTCLFIVTKGLAKGDGQFCVALFLSDSSGDIGLSLAMHSYWFFWLISLLVPLRVGSGLKSDALGLAFG